MSERKLIFIASPYAGDVEHNIEMAKRYCRHALECGCDFVAPHLIYPQVLNDANPEERQRGIRMGLRLLSFCDELWICGDKITEGMQAEIAEAKRLGSKIVSVHIDEMNEVSSEKWGVWAKRGPASILGTAEAWAKENGKVITFDSYEKAVETADAYMKNIGTANVSYYPKRMEPEQTECPAPDMSLRLT